MLEGTRVSVEGIGLDVELAACFAPSRNGGEYFMQDGFCFAGFEAKASGGSHRGGDGGFFLMLADGGFRRMGSIDFRHGIEVVGGRERPAPCYAHEEAVI